MYLFFDIETIGNALNPKAAVSNLRNWPRIIQLSFLQTDSEGTPLTSQQLLIQPDGFTIPAYATSNHGITTEHARAHGLPLRTALTEFLTVLDASTTLVAHNMPHDENVLGAEFLRAKLPNPLPKKNRICLMHSAINFCAIPGYYGKLQRPSLSQLHQKLFHKTPDTAPTSPPSIQVCATCFFALKSNGTIQC